MKSIRSTPSVHAVQGDERIRTAEQAPSTETMYEGVLREALRLCHDAFRATPVRDDTRDAHFALERLRMHLVAALRSGA